VEDRTSRADRARLPGTATGLIPIQIVRTERSIVARDTSDSADPISAMQGPGFDETKSRDYLQALEMIGTAARTMTSIEDESQRIRVNALALTQRVRSERIEAEQQVCVLQEQLKTSHFLADQLKQQLAEERAAIAELKASHSSIEELKQRLADAEERADLAEEWLQRFQEAIVSSFSALRAAEAAR
jgi:HPt (histidine-containing phosphotransfer) domain-containing protein